MIRIAGVKSNDKINFKEFVEFFYKVDWVVDNDEGRAHGVDKLLRNNSKTEEF